MITFRRSLAAVSALCLATAGILAAASGSGRADIPGAVGIDGRVVTLDQATGLDTRAVQVSWSGFDPTRKNGQFAVNIVQCTANPTALDRDCFNAQRYPSSDQGSIVLGATTRSDGTGSALFEVRSAIDLPSLACSATNACSVLVYEVTGTPVNPGAMPELYAVTPATFAPSPADCPPVTDFDARIGGEASVIPLAYRVAGASCLGSDPSILDVTESASNEGRDAVLNGQVDVGVTSVPATAEELAAHPEVLRVRYAPLDLTAVVVAFQLADPVTNTPITDLTLSPRLVARLISDSRPEEIFGDAEFQSLNPGRRWPPGGLSHPLLRAEANADAGFVTGWIDQDRDARAFLDGTDRYNQAVTPAWKGVPYPTDVFESRAATSGYIPLTGEKTVSRRLFYGVNPANLATSVNYTGVMGVLDLPSARRYGLSVARIVNGAGTPVAPTDEAILAGYRAMRTNPDGTRTTDFASTDPAAYPLVKIDYAMVTNTLGTARIDKTARFITDAVGTVQDTGGLLGYVPLPAPERTQAATVAANLTALITGIEPIADSPSDATSISGSYDTTSYSTYDTGYTDGSASSAGAASGGTTEIVHKGLVRFQPVVALSDPRRVDGLVLVFALGIIAGLAAIAPSAWSGVRRLLHR